MLTMSQPESSNSSSFTYSSTLSSFSYTYHVFLSFRGLDTRYGFTGHLYNALSDKGIQTFIDDEELRKGEEITPSLLKAIEESWIAIVVLSENYASSTFCLQELVKILECVKEKGRSVLPIFYGVNPSDVRYLKGSYGEAFTKHEARFKNDKEQVKKWKQALQEVSKLSGWHHQGFEYEFVLIRRIVEELFRKTQRIILHIANYPVGLEFQIKKLRSFLDFESNERVIMVGIYGIGGIGKTTIALAMYNRIADQFEAACFLANVRERSNWNDGLVQLQELLLSELGGRNNIKLSDVYRGIPILKQTLNKKKVLLILDDVDELYQLQALAGGLDWFGAGSIIIITTRDEHLLDTHGVKRRYMMEALNDKEAFKLFTWNAFKSNVIDVSYRDILNKFLKYCKGLPLALEIIGSNLFGKGLNEWESALDTYKKVPNGNIQEVLRVSYDHLDENEKDIFLDMACFFRGCKLEYVQNMLQNGHGLRPEYIVGVLIKRSLIKICSDYVTMHDLIQDMGREIVRQESPRNPGKRSRLWCYEDIRDVFEENKGTDEIQAIMLNAPRNSKVQWDGNALLKMKNLRILIVKNACFSCGPKHLPNSLRILDWEQYPSSSLPSDFNPRKLIILNLNRSGLISLDKPFQNFESLSEINLSNSNLERVPCVSGAPNLRKLILDGCTKLVEVHGSIGLLDKLETLSAYDCSNVKIFPEVIHSTSLKELDLTGCLSLSNFPEILGIMEMITICLDLWGRGLGSELRLSLGENSVSNYELESGHLMFPKVDKIMKGSFGHIREGEDQYHERGSTSFPFKVTSLYISGCSLRDRYPSKWLPCFPNLKKLDLSCDGLRRNKYLTDEFLSTHLPCFPNLRSLDLSRNNFTILPECINECHYLQYLNLDGCKQLREIRGMPPYMKILSARNCISLSDQSTRILTSQALHEASGTKFTLPGVTLPEWFAYKQPSQSLSFWVRNKFPEKIALCLVYNDSRFNIDLLVNGIKHGSIEYPWLKSRKPHIYVAHLDRRRDFSGEVPIGPGWNHVQLLINATIVSWMGVHVYKEVNSTENVRFTDPNPGKGKANYLRETDNNHAFHLNKKWCAFLDKKVRYNPEWEGVWKIQAPVEVKILMRKIFLDTLPTCVNLFKSNVIDSPLCPICETEYETIEHVFMFCEWTQRVWFGSDLQWHVDPEYDGTFIQWIFEKIRERVHTDFQEISYFRIFELALSVRTMVDAIVEGPQPLCKIMGTVGNICWAIWKGRKEYVVRSKPVDPQLALSRVKALSKQYSHGYTLVQTATTYQGTILPPPHQVLDINFDNSCLIDFTLYEKIFACSCLACSIIHASVNCSTHYTGPIIEDDNKAKGKSVLMASSSNTKGNIGQNTPIITSTSDKVETEQVIEPRSNIETSDSMIMDTAIHNEQLTAERRKKKRKQQQMLKCEIL